MIFICHRCGYQIDTIYLSAECHPAMGHYPVTKIEHQGDESTVYGLSEKQERNLKRRQSKEHRQFQSDFRLLWDGDK